MLSTSTSLVSGLLMLNVTDKDKLSIGAKQLIKTERDVYFMLFNFFPL